MATHLAGGFSTKWVSQNRSPSHRVERILDSSRHPQNTPGRPQSAQSLFLTRGAVKTRKHQGSEGIWTKPRPRGRGEAIGSGRGCLRRLVCVRARRFSIPRCPSKGIPSAVQWSSLATSDTVHSWPQPCRQIERHICAANDTMAQRAHTCLNHSALFAPFPSRTGDNYNSTKNETGCGAPLILKNHRSQNWITSHNDKHQPAFSTWSSAKASGKISFGNSDAKTDVGSSSPHCRGFRNDDATFPEWLRREMEFRQLTSADPSTLERRREEAATWIKKEVSIKRVVWYLVLRLSNVYIPRCKNAHLSGHSSERAALSP